MRIKKNPIREQSSAKYLVGMLLRADTACCQISHLKELLSVLIWKITQANGKYHLRYVSESALKEKSKKNIIHEHVFERAKLIEFLLKSPNDTDTILDRAIACLVTKQEHEQLGKVDKELDGWDRYRAAGIRVFDREADEFVL